MVEQVVVPGWLDDAKGAVLRDCPQLAPDDLQIVWDSTVLAFLENPVEPADPRCFVVRLGGSWTTLPVEQGAAAVTTAIASAVQDHVIDQMHRPWPELVDSDGRSAVLDVRSDGDRAWWVGTRFQRAPVGDLEAAARAQNLMILAP